MLGVTGESPLRLWLAIVGTATLLLGASYAMVQQSTRLAADDQPLQTAQTIKHELEGGADPSDVVPKISANLKEDTFVFATITDSARHVVASSAKLNGNTPLPPKGVFDYTSTHNNDHFTWQPAKGVRLATRVLTYNASDSSGFIITGQSLKPAEDRIATYTVFAAVAWIAIVGWTILLLLPAERKFLLKKK